MFLSCTFLLLQNSLLFSLSSKIRLGGLEIGLLFLGQMRVSSVNSTLLFDFFLRLKYLNKYCAFKLSQNYSG